MTLRWIAQHWELIIAIITAVTAVISAAASRTSAGTAKDALAEARRQHLISITPHVTARAQKMNEVPHAVRQDSVLESIVTNVGPGIARDIHGTLTVEHGLPSQAGDREVKELQVSIPQLPPGGSQVVDAPAASSRPKVQAGLLTYTDVENRKHWSRLLPPSHDWETGEGDHPERPEESCRVVT
jgi:hypothetical protein